MNEGLHSKIKVNYIISSAYLNFLKIYTGPKFIDYIVLWLGQSNGRIIKWDIRFKEVVKICKKVEVLIALRYVGR